VFVGTLERCPSIPPNSRNCSRNGISPEGPDAGRGKIWQRSAGGLTRFAGIDLEGRIVKDGVKKALRDRQDALSELVDAVRQYRKLADSKPLTLQENDYVKALERLNAAVERADGLVAQ
jgi:hypothetical protein